MRLTSQILRDGFSARVAIELPAEISVQEIEPPGARNEPPDAAIEMHEVQHPAPRRHTRCAAKIFEVEKVEPHRAVALLDHDVGFLKVARVDAGVMHAAKFGGERVRDGFAARISVARFPFAP